MQMEHEQFTNFIRSPSLVGPYICMCCEYAVVHHHVRGMSACSTKECITVLTNVLYCHFFLHGASPQFRQSRAKSGRQV